IASCYPTVAAAEAAALLATTATDNCVGGIVETANTVGTCSALVTVTETDGCGNSSTTSYTTRIDNAPPVVMGGTIAACYHTVAEAEAAALAATSATDACPGVIIEMASTVGTCSATVTVTETDQCGNQSSFTYSTRIDNTAPVIITGTIATCYQTVGDAEAAALLATTATDNCSGAIVEAASTIGTCTAIVTVTETDGCGNQSATTYTTRIDNTPPMITTGTIASCYPTVAAAEAAALLATTATDNCVGDILESASTVGTCMATITVTETDGCGNTASVSYTASVDGIAPDISTCPVTRTIEGCNTSAITGPVFSPILTITTIGVFQNETNQGVVTDNCIINSVSYIDAVGATTCPTVVTRTWTITDACGNSSSCSQTINVNDTTSPVFTFCPPNTTINCPQVPVFPIATATDVCSPAVVITFANVTVQGSCPGQYSVTRTWTAVDNCGNSASCSAMVTVQDITPPVIHCPDDLVLQCTAGANYVALINSWLATATATDLCDANVAISNNYDGVSIPSFTCQGGLVITFTAVDDCGNTATCTSTIRKPCFTVESWVYLEGSATNPNGLPTYTLPMRTTLNNLRLLPGQTVVDPFLGNKYTPAGQPYSGPPWNYPGNEGSLFDSGGNPMFADAGYPPTVTDWVLVSIRADSAGTGGPICEAAALLHKDGTIQFVQPLTCCGISESQSYYIVIEHRNHLIVMSAAKTPFINHKMTYDFRNQQSWEDPLFAGFNIFARQKEILTGQFAMFAGNGNQSPSANADTDINFDDRTFWEGQNGQVGQYRVGDYNLNGDTNFNDRITWERNNGKFTSVPRN
ncbi:MAG: HYR domain-containing protein, partial [Saprospiraceae bacterium]